MSNGQDDDQPPAVDSPFQPKAGDSAAEAQWRQRVDIDEAGEIYKIRSATAECVNARARIRGLLRTPVRAQAEVKPGAAPWQSLRRPCVLGRISQGASSGARLQGQSQSLTAYSDQTSLLVLAVAMPAISPKLRSPFCNCDI